MTHKKCESCNKNSVTVNYIRKNKTYYRKICYYCIKERRNQKDKATQLLKKSGYKKKAVCDRCGFKSKNTEQMKIYFKDGNTYNVSLSNLRSYCVNCIIEIKNDPTADQKDIIADY